MRMVLNNVLIWEMVDFNSFRENWAKVEWEQMVLGEATTDVGDILKGS